MANNKCPISGQEINERNECAALITQSGNYFIDMGDFSVYVAPNGNPLRQTDLSEWKWLREKLGASAIVWVARPNIKKDFEEIGEVWEDVQDTEQHIGTVTQYADGSIKLVFDTVCWHSYPGAAGRQPLSPRRVEEYNSLDGMPSEYKFKAY